MDKMKTYDSLQELTDLKEEDETGNLTLVQCIEKQMFPAIDAKIYQKSKARFDHQLERQMEKLVTNQYLDV